jgi:FkbM family methyltransferase
MLGSLSKPYYQRVSYRFLKKMFGTITVNVGTKKISVPLIEEAGLFLLHWNLSWKTRLIAKRLRNSHGALLDVGANVGQTLFDFLYAQSGESIYYGFEPNVSAAAYLVGLIRQNKIGNAFLVPVALGKTSEVTSIHIRRGGSVYASDALITEYFRPSQSFNKSYISCFSLDSILQSLHIPKISMIKIDVEHSELMALEGMMETLHKIRPPVCCEVLHRDGIFPADQYHQYLLKLEELLSSIDFKIFQLVHHGDDEQYQLEPVSEFPRAAFTSESYDLCDYLFLPNELEVSEFAYEA